MSKDVKRWWITAQFDNDIEVVAAKDHDRIVADLRVEVENLSESIAEAREAIGARSEDLKVDIGWLVEERDELRAEVEKLNAAIEYFKEKMQIFRNREYGFENENERLKRYTQHRIDCIRRVGVFEYSNDCDCGLDAIEKGEA